MHKVTKAIQVALVEDDPGVRANLAAMLNTTPGFHCQAAYADGATALAGIPSSRPDVVLMDINLPGMLGPECVRHLKTIAPGLPVLMLTVYDDSEQIFKSLMAGANGYMLKRTSPAQLLAAVKEAHTGGVPMTPEMARRVAKYFQDLPRPTSDVERLTRREVDVLEQLAKGYRYKEIEENLQISTGTLRSYITNVYEKLHVHSRTEAVVKYLNRQEQPRP